MTNEEESLVDEAADEAIEEGQTQALSTRGGAGEDDIDDRNPRVYEEFREHVRRLPCLACQREDGMVGDDFDFILKLDRVSDPHHVTTRGAGGHDAENLVPMCRKHHGEVGSLGSSAWQIKYNIDLRVQAVNVYQAFLDSDKLQDIAAKTFALHRRIVARIDDAKKAMMRVADEILEFVDTKYNGRPAFTILGFTSAEAYFSSPVESGGLGLKQRTAYRMLAMARVKEELGGDDDAARKLGTYKSELILPHLRTEEDPQKKQEMASAVASMPLEDARAWSARKQGLPDRRQIRHDQVLIILKETFEKESIAMELQVMDNLAWRVVSACAKA